MQINESKHNIHDVSYMGKLILILNNEHLNLCHLLPSFASLQVVQVHHPRHLYWFGEYRKKREVMCETCKLGVGTIYIE